MTLHDQLSTIDGDVVFNSLLGDMTVEDLRDLCATDTAQYERSEKDDGTGRIVLECTDPRSTMPARLVQQFVYG